MLVMRTTENPAYPLGKLVSTQQTVGLDHLTFAVNPFGLDGIQPRALLGQKAAYDPHSSYFAGALFDLAVVFSEPASEFAAYVPACIVPDEEQDLLAHRFEPLTTPLKEAGRYSTHGPTIHEPQPRLVELGQIESVTGDGLRFRIVFFDRLLDEARKGFPCSAQLLKVGKATLLHQHSSSKPTAHWGLASATSISRSRRLFFFRIGDRER